MDFFLHFHCSNFHEVNSHSFPYPCISLIPISLDSCWVITVPIAFRNRQTKYLYSATVHRIGLRPNAGLQRLTIWGNFPHGKRCHSHFHLRSFQLLPFPFPNWSIVPIPVEFQCDSHSLWDSHYYDLLRQLAAQIKDIHTYIIHKTTGGNDYKSKYSHTHTCNHTKL